MSLERSLCHAEEEVHRLSPCLPTHASASIRTIRPLRRATGIETALFESMTVEPNKSELNHSRLSLIGPADVPEQNQTFLGATRQSDAAATKECSFDPKKDIADGFLRLAALPTFPLERISRYEYMLWRQARQVVFTLESLRRRKRQPIRSTFPFSFRRREPGTLPEEFR